MKNLGGILLMNRTGIKLIYLSFFGCKNLYFGWQIPISNIHVMKSKRYHATQWFLSLI